MKSRWRWAPAATLLILGCSNKAKCSEVYAASLQYVAKGAMNSAREMRAVVWKECGETKGWELDKAIAQAEQQFVAAPSPVAAAPVMPSCLLSVRGTDKGPVVFPTEDGAKEFDNALTDRALSADVVNRVIRLNRGWIADYRTPCSMIAEGFSHSKVRVLEGTGSGEAGWVPTSQTKGH